MGQVWFLLKPKLIIFLEIILVEAWYFGESLAPGLGSRDEKGDGKRPSGDPFQLLVSELHQLWNGLARGLSKTSIVPRRF